jgi:hypothetical protein
MIPIYEQGGGHGIGHNLNSFLSRFDAIIAQHQETGRAKAFAFIFYDFADNQTRKILKDEGVFATLDRRTGNDLSIFYLHTGTRHAVERFNEVFLQRLEIAETAKPPCVAFFKLAKGELSDISVVVLEDNLIHAFNELDDAIEQYLKNSIARPRYIRWLKGTTKFLGVEAFKEAIKYTLFS